MQIVSRPFQLLLAFAILLILSSFLAGRGTLDIHLSDTYYVFDGVFIIRAMAMLLLLDWLLYRFTYKFLFSRALIWVHVLITIALVIVVVVFLFSEGRPHPRRYFDYNYTDISDVSGKNVINFIPGFIILLLLAQLLYIINLLLGVLRRLN